MAEPKDDWVDVPVTDDWEDVPVEAPTHSDSTTMESASSLLEELGGPVTEKIDVPVVPPKDTRPKTSEPRVPAPTFRAEQIKIAPAAKDRQIATITRDRFTEDNTGLYDNPKNREAYYKKLGTLGYNEEAIRDNGEAVYEAKQGLPIAKLDMQRNPTLENTFQVATYSQILGDNKTALELYEGLLNRNEARNSPSFWYGYGNVKAETGDIEGAREAYRNGGAMAKQQIRHDPSENAPVLEDPLAPFNIAGNFYKFVGENLENTYTGLERAAGRSADKYGYVAGALAFPFFAADEFEKQANEGKANILGTTIATIRHNDETIIKDLEYAREVATDLMTGGSTDPVSIAGAYVKPDGTLTTQGESMANRVGAALVKVGFDAPMQAVFAAGMGTSHGVKFIASLDALNAQGVPTEIVMAPVSTALQKMGVDPENLDDFSQSMVSAGDIAISLAAFGAYSKLTKKGIKNPTPEQKKEALIEAAKEVEPNEIIAVNLHSKNPEAAAAQKEKLDLQDAVETPGLPEEATLTLQKAIEQKDQQIGKAVDKEMAEDMTEAETRALNEKRDALVQALNLAPNETSRAVLEKEMQSVPVPEMGTERIVGPEGKEEIKPIESAKPEAVTEGVTPKIETDEVRKDQGREDQGKEGQKSEELLTPAAEAPAEKPAEAPVEKKSTLDEKEFPKKGNIGELKVGAASPDPHRAAEANFGYDYEVHSEVRYVNPNDFDLSGYRATQKERQRIEYLKNEILDNERIDPVLIAKDGDQVWILEGQHRMRAMQDLGYDVPAIVIESRKAPKPEPVKPKENAVQKPSAKSVLPREQKEVGEAGREREGVGSVEQGKETPQTSQKEVVDFEQKVDQVRETVKAAAKKFNIISADPTLQKMSLVDGEKVIDKAFEMIKLGGRTVVQVRKSVEKAIRYVKDTDWYRALVPEQRKMVREALSEVAKKRTEDNKSEIKDYLRTFVKDTKSFPEQMKEYLTSKEISGQFTESQIKVLLNRSSRVRTAHQAEKFFELADRIIDDANLAAEFDRADRLSKKVKAKAPKALVNNKDLMQALGRIPVRELDDVKEFNEIAQGALDAQLPVTNQRYRPFDNARAQRFLEEVQARLDKQYLDAIHEKYDMAGLTKEEAKELDEFMEAEDADVYLANLAEAKKKALRDKLQSIAEYSQVGAVEADFSSFSERGQRWMETIRNADLSLLSPRELREYIRTVDNAVVNNTNANIGSVAATVKGRENAAASTSIEGVKNLDINTFEKAYYSLPLILKKVFGGSEKVARTRLLSGIEDVFNGGSRTNRAVDLAESDYKKFKKENKVSNSSEHNMIRQIYAYIIQHSGGTADQIADRFNDNKKKVAQSIDVYESTKSKRRLGEVARAAFEQFRNLDTIEEVKAEMERLYPEDKKAVEYWQGRFEEHKEALRENTEAFHNEKFNDEFDYTPQTVRLVNRTRETPPEEIASFQRTDMPFKPKQSPTTISRSKAKTLPEGWAIDFDFDANMINKYQKGLYDINTSESRAVFREFMKTEDAVKLFGGIDNANAIVKVFNESEMMQRNAGPADSDTGRMINGLTQTLRNMATSTALGGFTQWLKQYPSVGLGTIVRLGMDAPLMAQAFRFAKDNPIFDQFTISERAAREGGYDRGERLHNRMNSRLGDSVIGRVGEWMKDASYKTKNILFASLRTGDVSIAKRSWIAYYLQSLKKQGVDLASIDPATEWQRLGEPERQLAAAYAEQVVKETQIPSNPAEISQLQRASGSAAQRTLKDIFMPFSNFSSNMRARMINDVIRLKNGTSEDRIEAGKDLSAAISETVAFHAISGAIIGAMVYPLGKQVLHSMFGLQDDEKTVEEKNQEVEFRIKKMYSNVTRDLVASGFGTITENAFIDGLNRAAYYLYSMTDSKEVMKEDGTTKTYTEFEKEAPFYRYRGKEGKSDFGLYQIMLDKPEELGQDIEGVINGTVTQEYYGRPTTKKLSEDQQDYMMFMLVMDMLSTVGATDADLYRMAQQTKREQIKGAKSIKKDKSKIEKKIERLTDVDAKAKRMMNKVEFE